MAVVGSRWGILKSILIVFCNYLFAFAFVSAERSLKHDASRFNSTKETSPNYLVRAMEFLWQPDQPVYEHVWPELEFGWQIIAGTIVGSFGAAFGSVGGIGGGGIFVPMLSIIIGFDPKSATAMSKCMIMGAAGTTVYYNLKQRHPTLDLPIIDYDLVLIIQPMLMLGISIGVAFSVVFADWMLTVLLLILFIGTSLKAFFKGVETWKAETVMQKELAKRLESNNGSGIGEVEYKPLPSNPQIDTKKKQVGMLQNIYWKELGLLVFVWVSFLALQIAKNSSTTCSTAYWILNLLQIPISVGVFSYEAVGLYKGTRVISSRGDLESNWPLRKIIFCACCGLVAGMVGGLLGIGGGFVMGPLFLELGVPPQVASASATFGMTFSSSMSVVEYYLLNRFPVPYAIYFIAVAAIAAYIGQKIMTKVIAIFGRASLIIFVLAFTIFVSAVSLGGVGIAKMIGKIQRHEYMGFEDLCKYDGLSLGIENLFRRIL
ncbi:sulfite exporter TauE/SafE family protein 3 isoform X2 [Ziziphus jujuba]|uniref:Sulfite exporter TauE/SafE family protein 3 isoform X2 n=2 Tax=Ziziphus jujuba TaxID=326968 RepID=A0A6P3ZY85_ZIZJJ|nr:sulfite exporter TauE/SafE family protein 3 isoform X2 [Ziziphus jujuba]KAH7524210.1 hypothetical protein FEM48_Zijuj06G0095000 [Ziziphus jujuba var. spinosa]